MKYFALIATLFFLSACNQMSSRTNRVTDSGAGVQLIPRSFPDQNMPVDTTDTSVTANMPVIDPDTSKVQPK
ncbi:hypothetical protein [Polluticoccus soli]|uniref:hypothetical protein n=1 Tax=Polluticoccus soli TaxID=3034150 RepID=UPI0023E1A8FC|nr:hypothetical protein [Flavipsychrobacter sp. JY13-12]